MPLRLFQLQQSLQLAIFMMIGCNLYNSQTEYNNTHISHNHIYNILFWLLECKFDPIRTRSDLNNSCFTFACSHLFMCYKVFVVQALGALSFLHLSDMICLVTRAKVPQYHAIQVDIIPGMILWTFSCPFFLTGPFEKLDLGHSLVLQFTIVSWQFYSFSV